MSHNESNLRTPTPSSRSLNPKGKPKVNNSKDPSNTFTPVNENKSTLIIPPAVKRKQSGNLSRTVKRSIKRKPSKFNERITINSGDNGSKKVNCNTLQGTSCDPPHKQDGEVSCDSMPHFKYNQENGINHDGLNNVQKEQSGGEALNDNSQESNTTVKIENTGSNENENLNEPLKKSYDEIINDYEKTSSRNIKTIHGASVLKPAELYDVDNISIGYKEIMELHNDEQMKLMEEFSQFTDEVVAWDKAPIQFDNYRGRKRLKVMINWINQKESILEKSRNDLISSINVIKTVLGVMDRQLVNH